MSISAGAPATPWDWPGAWLGMKAVGQLTGGIARDFNNLLAVIMGALNIMQRRVNRGGYRIAGFMDAAIEGAQRRRSRLRVLYTSG